MKEKTILIGFILFFYLCEGFTQNHPPQNNEYIPQFEWLRNYPIDQVYSSSIDSSGNIYVVCIDSNRPNILKFKQTGILIWHKIYDFIPGSYRILITNKMNECFYLATSNQEHEYLLSKHDTSGNILWSKVVGLGGYEEPTAMTLDNKGNIIITGHGEGIYPSTCGLTIKYNPEGDTLWARKEYVNGNMVYVVNSITTDRYGNVFINGNNGIGLNNYGVMQTIKYDSLGNRKWVRQYINNLLDYEILGYEIKTDESGNCYAVGTIAYSYMKRTSILIKYNPEGDSLWSRKYITPDTLNYGGCGYVDLDNYGNIIISGSEIRKYDENGSLLLNIDKNQLMQLGLHELGGGRAINFQNNIYFSNYGFFDCLTLGFNNSGINIFNQRYPEHMLSYNVVCKNFDKYKNSLILVCKSPGPGTYVKDSCVIIKYSVPTYIKNISSNQEINYRLYQNYPNPFNSRTKIEFRLPNMTFAEIKLYDISGREISVLLKTQLPEGRHGVVFDSGELASGTYFYSLFAGNKIQATKKLIVLK